MVGVTCATEGAAGVVATLGLVRNLSRGAVKVQVGGYPTGLDGHQVSSDTYNVNSTQIRQYTESTRTKPESKMRKKTVACWLKVNLWITVMSVKLLQWNLCIQASFFSLSDWQPWVTSTNSAFVPRLFISLFLSLTHQHAQPFPSLSLFLPSKVEWCSEPQ